MRYIAVLFSLLSGMALACKCEPGSTDPKRAFANHDVVAMVKICEAHLENDSGTVSVTATGVVTDSFKGSYNEKFTIQAGNPNSSCHTPIAVGRSYLVFGTNDGHAYIGYCQPSGEPHQVGYEYMRSIQHLSSNKKRQPTQKTRGCF